MLTVPNFLSLARLCCIPWFVWLVFVAKEEYQAAWVLAVLGTTDWVDGFVARHFNQESTFGKVFDPTVDRILLMVAGITLIVVGAMPWWFGFIALMREVLIGLGGIYLGLHGHKRLDVRLIGKAGAFSLMFSFPFFLASHSGVFWHEWAAVGAWSFGVVGLVCSWVSAYFYFMQARKLFQ